MRRGDAALYRLVRGGPCAPPAPVLTADGSYSIHPVDILADEMPKWKSIWLKHPDAAAPRRGIKIAEKDRLPIHEEARAPQLQVTCCLTSARHPSPR